jgi:hypothetical protein
MYNKTLVSCDHWYTKPRLLKRLSIWIWNGRLSYNKDKECWEEKYIVKGHIEKGWFYPNFLESISYKIFWPYGSECVDKSDFYYSKIMY